MRMTIEFEKPPGATVDDVADFVISSLSSWGGGLHPEDPMFHSLRGKIRWLKVYGKQYVPDEARYGQR